MYVNISQTSLIHNFSNLFYELNRRLSYESVSNSVLIPLSSYISWTILSVTMPGSPKAIYNNAQNIKIGKIENIPTCRNFKKVKNVPS